MENRKTDRSRTDCGVLKCGQAPPEESRERFCPEFCPALETEQEFLAGGKAEQAAGRGRHEILF